jgi:hypothetical protein
LRCEQLALMHAVVAGDDGLDVSGAVDGRVGIYRQAYRARLVAALRDNYGTLPVVMGDDAFEALAHAYIDAVPPRHASIRWFGDRLVAFMTQRAALVAHPALVELAALEWALRGAFDAAAAAPLDAAALAAVPARDWPRLVFAPVPSVRVLSLRWQVEPIWQALKGLDGGQAPELAPPQESPHGVLVWRPALEVRWRTLEPGLAALLQSALQGSTFGALCEHAAATVGEPAAAAYAAGALRAWVADGLFSGWSLHGTAAA